MSTWGPPTYTKRDATSDLLRFADMTSADGSRRPGPHGRDCHWRSRLGRLLVLALRGVP